MEKENLLNEISRIISESRLGTLSTMRGDQPFSRYMIFRHDGFKLYCVSSKQTNKVRDIEHNDKVHILLGFEGGGFGKPYLDISATATIHDEKELKDRLWHDNFLKYLEGPNDPNYIVIECEPKIIRLINHPDLDGPYTFDVVS
ncbi:pyridoxamine 5'-phosphate oxidase family protein [Robertmurraya andreesenii]|uniref:General stress protein 26 n=1 Tax=Anoxybacillus andreesenii TaxID=1325932 RepID=A0ABT9UZB2_9BACL|nr:pyridoxamine 5'-phosphate oxidase family protein [Robertmurraya andreesenii]MDQ0154027.1 general stress protein 26 [Robertmurraya andreesenii]